VRRFFLFDTVSGIEDDYELGTSISTVVRYPKTIKLNIRLDLDNEEMIYTPMLIIDYRERTISYINQQNALAEVEFISEYAMDTTNFWTNAQGVFIGVNVLAGLILLYRLGVVCAAPSLAQDTEAKVGRFSMSFFILVFDLFSYFYFWFLFGMTAYWFIFFKIQERVFLLMPNLNTYQTNYKPFVTIFAIATCFKFVAILLKIYFEQAEFDVFIIDWERPKFKKHFVPRKKPGEQL